MHFSLQSQIHFIIFVLLSPPKFFSLVSANNKPWPLKKKTSALTNALCLWSLTGNAIKKQTFTSLSNVALNMKTFCMQGELRVVIGSLWSVWTIYSFTLLWIACRNDMPSSPPLPVLSSELPFASQLTLVSHNKQEVVLQSVTLSCLYNVILCGWGRPVSFVFPRLQILQIKTPTAVRWK